MSIHGLVRAFMTFYALHLVVVFAALVQIVAWPRLAQLSRFSAARPAECGTWSPPVR